MPGNWYYMTFIHHSEVAVRYCNPNVMVHLVLEEWRTVFCWGGAGWGVLFGSDVERPHFPFHSGVLASRGCSLQFSKLLHWKPLKSVVTTLGGAGPEFLLT